MFKKALEQYCIMVDDIHMHMLLLRSYPELPNPIIAMSVTFVM